MTDYDAAAEHCVALTRSLKEYLSSGERVRAGCTALQLSTHIALLNAAAAAAPGAGAGRLDEGAAAAVAPLQLLAVTLLAPARPLREGEAAPPPEAGQATLALLHAHAAAMEGHEFFARQALLAAHEQPGVRELLKVSRKDGEPELLPHRLFPKTGFKVAAAALVDGCKWTEGALQSVLNETNFKEGVFRTPGSPYKGFSPSAVAQRLFSPPPLSAQDKAALRALLDSSFARIGTWNVLGNAVFKTERAGMGGAAAMGAAVAAAAAGHDSDDSEGEEEEGSHGAGGAARAHSHSANRKHLAAALASSPSDRSSYATAKVRHLEALIARERWSALALQELPDNASFLHALQGHTALLAHWAFVPSGSTGRGMSTRHEAVVFGYDRRCWGVAAGGGPVVLGGAGLALLKRKPAALVLVSMHLHSKSARAREEVRALGSALGAALAAAGLHIDLQRDAIALVGDFNLAPPGHDEVHVTAPGTAWDALLGGAAAAGAPAGEACTGFVSAKRCSTATNVWEFGSGAEHGHEYDGALVRVPWAAGGGGGGHCHAATASVVDIVHGCSSSLAREVAAVHSAIESMMQCTQDAALHGFAAEVDKRWTELGLREKARARFLGAWSDHKPLTLVIGSEDGAGGGGGGGEEAKDLWELDCQW